MNTKQIAHGALIAAVYTLLTYAIAPISSGLIQCRVSEALCVLPYFTPAAVPGLFIGCLVSNFLVGAVAYDIIFGSIATLIAAILTRLISKRFKGKLGILLAPLPAVIVNAVVIGYLLANIYVVGVPFLACAAYVALGQAIACYALGVPLMYLLNKYPLFN